MPRKPKLDDTQCGFCRGCSTTVEISTLQKTFKKSWEHAKDVYTCFVDLGKVYGLNPCEKFWVMLWEHGVDKCLLLAAKSPYSCSEDCVRVDGVNSQLFSAGVGLRQCSVLSSLLFIVYIGVLHTTARGPNPTDEAISPGRKTHFANNEIPYSTVYLHKMWWLGRMQHIPRKTLRKMFGPRTVVQYLMSSFPKNLKSLGLYELDRQSQTRRRGCHCWELQGEPFVFCGRIGTACVDLLNKIFSTHLIGFLLRATTKERKSALKRLRYYVSPKAVYSASERQYTAAGGDVQVPWGGIHEWRKWEPRD